MALRTLGYAKVLKDERGRLIVDRSTLRRKKKGRFAGGVLPLPLADDPSAA